MAIQSYDEALLALLRLEPVETETFNEARAVIASPELAQLRNAFLSARNLEVVVRGWTIVFETKLPTVVPAMTLFGERGFVLGNSAFASVTELQKTILHELYRLCSKQKSSGVPGTGIAAQTKAAIEFSELAWPILQWLP